MANHSAFCEHGDEAYSYATCIRTRREDGTWILNVTHYTKTTGRHQREAGCMTLQGIRVDNVPRGATATDLRTLALL